MKRTSLHILLGVSAMALTTGTAGAANNWQLVFNDEFSASSFDSDGTLQWNTEGGQWNKIGYVNWGVSDWRKYQSTDDALVTQGDGYVTLKGSYGDYTSQSDQTGAENTFACGGIFTDKTFSFQYGYVEVRAKFESAQGVWPAIWLMPKSGGWPDAGEIDIMEHLNNEAKVYQTLHMLNNSGTGDVSGVNTQPSISGSINAWHTYGMEWTADSITFYLDGKKTGTFSASDFTNWPFDDGREFYLLIDQQIGGSWPGDANAATLQSNSADFNIDYVRVFSTDSGAVTSTTGWNGAPTDADDNLINYTNTPNKNAGVLDMESAGNYSFNINGSISSLVAEGSHVKLTTDNSTSEFNIDNALVRADSLFVESGKYKLSGTALDVNTLYVAGGSLEVGAMYALSSIKKIYLGMETDVITQSAQRNAALYFTANQDISADIELVNDSKIAIYQGNTVSLNGNISAAEHTLNIVGVNSNGTANIILGGENNSIGRLTLGIAETTPAGNTFNGGGQILAVRLTGGNTEVEELVTNSPVAGSPSSLTINNGATLTVTEHWQNKSTNNFNFTVGEGSTLNIGNGVTAASATQLTGVTLVNKGLLHVQANSELNIGSITIDSSGNADGNRAKLQVDGTLTADSIHINGKSWKSIGTLDISNGDNAHIGAITTGNNGQVDINVRSGTLHLQSITPSAKQPLVLQAETSAKGTICIEKQVNNAKELHVRAGRVEFQGGMSGSGSLVVKNDATVAIKGAAANNAISLEKNSTLETAGDFSGGSISGNGTISKTDSGTATVSVNSDFTGSVQAQAGNMNVTGVSRLITAAANGGALTLSASAAAISLQNLHIDTGSTLSVLNSSGQNATVNIADNGMLTANGGTLTANVVLTTGTTLATANLSLQGSLTLNGLITLGELVEPTFLLDRSGSYTLATDMSSFITDGHEWTDGETSLASDYFTSSLLNLDQYELAYHSADGVANSGMLTLTLIPEPTTATLSLLALCSLAIRRRRK